MLTSGVSEALNFREVNLTHLFIDLLTIFIVFMIAINALRIIVVGSADNKVY